MNKKINIKIINKYIFLVGAFFLCLFAFACFSAEDHDITITFETNGGTVIAPKTYKLGDDIIAPSDPQKENYIFTGWYKDKECTKKFTFDKTILTNIVLYAGWRQATDTEITRTIIFVDGINSTSVTILDGKKLTEPTTPVKDGYSFTGWFTDEEGKNKYDFNLSVTANFTLYAGWNKLPASICIISFVTAGQPIKDISLEKGSKIEQMPEASNPGYKFIGWFLDSEFEKPFDINQEINNSMIIYVKWEEIVVINYNVKFFFEEELYKTEVVIENEKVNKPNEPVKVGYTFLGWFINEDEFDFESKIVSDLILEAKFEILTFKVVININEDNIIEDTKNYGEVIEKPTDPIMKGYTFKGWYKESTYSSLYRFQDKVVSDVNIYAKWEINQYKVSFQSNGGNPISTQLISYHGLVTKPIDPLQTGYDFVGFYSDKDFTLLFDFSTLIENDQIIYLKWKIKEYTVSYQTNGGAAINDVKVEHGRMISIPLKPLREGYEFVDWYKDEEQTIIFDFTKPIINDTIIYAKWNIISYEVDFDTLGGSKISRNLVEYDGLLTKPVDPVKSGYIFIGWYLDLAFEKPYDFTQTIKKSITLYAKWTVIEYTVSFNTLGANAIKEQVVSYANKALKPTDPIKEGSIFQGWFIDSDYSVAFNFEEVIYQNITLYAKWEVLTFIVTFQTNGGSIVSTNIINYNETLTRPMDPTKEHFEFVGWYTDDNYSLLFDFNTKITKDITLFAKWKEIKHAISFDFGYDYTIPDVIVSDGGILTEPDEVVRTHYTFIGWYKDKELNNLFDFNQSIKSNLTLYAKWTIDTFEIIFNSNGGTTIANQIIEYNSCIVKPTNPVKENYSFINWYKDEELTIIYDFQTPVESNLELFARWGLITHTISFNTFGGSLIYETNVANNELLIKPIDPIKVGYTFINWYKDENLLEQFDFNQKIVNDLVLYAKWEKNVYDVKFISDLTTISSQRIAYLDKATMIDAPTKTGYNFIGWYKDLEYTQLYSFNDPIIDNMELYAKWDIIKLDISFLTNGGDAIESYSVDYGTIIIPPTPVKNGYEFKGWFVNDVLYNSSNIVTTNLVLSAKWEIVQVTVSFNTNQGSNINNQTIDYGQMVTKPSDPIKAGYVFVGWYMNIELTNEFSFSIRVTNDIILYAKWSITTNKVIFDSLGGTNIGTLNISYGEKASKPTNPTKTGYTFINWYKDLEYNNLFDFNTSITSETKLYAKWQINEYTLTFIVNGGSTVASQTVKYNEKFTMPTTPIKVNYLFAGWYTNNNFTETYDFNCLAVSDITIYAKWTNVTYTIYYHTLGGSNINNSIVNSGDKVVRPTSPTKEGFVFVNWYIDENFETLYDFNTLVYENKNLYAKWTESIYTITLDTNGAEELEPITAYNGDVIDLPTPVKNKCTFVGWYKDSNLTTQYTAGPITNNFTLYAKWFDFKLTLNSSLDGYIVTEALEKEKIIIPNTYNNLPIKEISNECFMNYARLKEIILPNNLIIVGEKSFYNCTSLMEISLPDSVNVIGNSAFGNNSKLKTITFKDNINSVGTDILGGSNLINAIYCSDNKVEYLVNLLGEKYRNIIVEDRRLTPIAIDTGFFGETLDTNMASVEELAIYFDYVAYHKIDSFTVNFEFEFDDLQTVLREALSKMQTQADMSVSASYNGESIVINLTYKSFATTSASSSAAYTQLDSVCEAVTSTRDSNFSDFAINANNKTILVSDSEQLYYALNQGYRPIFPNYPTKAEELYNDAISVLRTIVDDNMNDIEKLHRIYDWIILNVTYDDALFDKVINSEDNLLIYNGFYLEGVFDDARAVCDGIAKAFVVLARIEGIECVRVTGTALDGGYGHAWNKVNISGIWYNIDATGGGLIVGNKEILMHNRFLVSDDFMDNLYEIEDYTYLIANLDYNYYQRKEFTFETIKYDYFIDSQDELNVLFKYYKDSGQTASTIDFYINFDFGTDILDEMQIAVNEAFININSYAKSGNAFVLLGFYN